jgi:hypothetical protein
MTFMKTLVLAAGASLAAASAPLGLTLIRRRKET